ncbi:MAG: hypothetical protein ACYCPK_00755 [Acidimicrobiales bacterium]
MSDVDDRRLLDALGDALAPRDVVPDPFVRARLLSALEGPAPLAVARARSWRRRVAHHGGAWAVAAAGVFVVSAVAAAAVVTDTLPGPTRAIAYDLGLPVTSPALHQTESDLSNLRHALAAHDRRDVRSLAQRVARDVRTLDAHDLGVVRAQVRVLLRAASQLGGVGSVVGSVSVGGSTPTIPTTTTTSSSRSTTTTSPSAVPTVPNGGSPLNLGGSTTTKIVNGVTSLLP